MLIVVKTANLHIYIHMYYILDICRFHIMISEPDSLLIILGLLCLAFRVSSYHGYLSNSIIIIFELVNIFLIA